MSFVLSVLTLSNINLAYTVDVNSALVVKMIFASSAKSFLIHAFVANPAKSGNPMIDKLAMINVKTLTISLVVSSWFLILLLAPSLFVIWASSISLCKVEKRSVLQIPCCMA